MTGPIEHTPAPRMALVGAFAAIYLVWGSTYLAIRIGIETMPPFLMAGLRFVAAGVPFYLFLRLRGTPRPSLRHWRSALVVGTLMLASGNGLVTWAELSVPSGLAAVMIATVPLWMTSLEVWPFRRARLSAGAVAGLICGLAGVVVLVAPGGDAAGSPEPAGAAALLVAALSWAVGSLLARSLELPRAPLATAAMQMIAGGAVLLVWGSLRGEWAAFDLAAVSLRSWMALAYLVVFGSIVAYAAYLFLMHHTTARAVSTYAFVNPVVAVLLGWAFAGEVFGLRAWVATALVVGAVVLLQGTRRPPVRLRSSREETPWAPRSPGPTGSPQPGAAQPTKGACC